MSDCPRYGLVEIFDNEIYDDVQTKVVPSNQANVLAVRQSIGRLSSWLNESKRWPIHEGLTMHQAWALYHIVENEAVRPGELANLIEASSASTTSVLDRLERHGLIERRQDPQERRANIATPTDKALQVWPKIAKRIQAAADKTFQSWTSQDLQTFQSYIDRFLRDATPPEAA